MECIMGIELVLATEKDAELIWKMQVEAFSGLLLKYQDMETNPANETLEKVLWKVQQTDRYFYLIKSNEDYMGAICIVDDKTKENPKRISPLFVLPQYRNKGIAQQAIAKAEEIHGSDNWELSTILQEKGNCYLYEKMGYCKTGETSRINDKLTLVFYKK